MFTFSYDAAFRLAVFLFSGNENTDADYQAYCDIIGKLATRLQAYEGSAVSLPASVIVVDPHNPIPNARWRQEIAEVSARLRPPMIVAMVSDSSLVRGAITAMNWLRPPPFEIQTFPTFEDALAWLETRREVKLPQLTALLSEAREHAANGTLADSARRIRHG